jgi:hypothetical protein
MPSDNFSYKELRDLNDRNYILDLSAGIRLHLRNRLHDRDRKVRSGTPFFRLNRILPADESAGTTVKSISTKQITQSIKQPIPIGKRKKRRR